MASGSGWDNDSVLNLIREYERRPILWKRDHKMYYNIANKEEAWRELSEVCEEDIDTVKRKIDSLRGSRRKEKNRILHSITSNKGGKNIYVPKWFAWESMKFLDDAGENRTLPTNVDVIDLKNELVNDDNDKNGIEDDTMLTDEDIERHLRDSESDYNQKAQIDVAKKRFIPRKQAVLKRKHADLPRIQDALRIMQNRSRNEKKDECAIFGDFVSEKMRKLDDRTRSVLQFEFHNLLFQAEMGTLPSLPQNPSKLLNTSANAGHQTPSHPRDEPGPSCGFEDDDPLTNMKVEPEEVELNPAYVKSEPTEEESLGNALQFPENVPIGDDIDVFFKEVADTVRQLPDDLAAEARQRISEMLRELQERAVKKENVHQTDC